MMKVGCCGKVMMTKTEAKEMVRLRRERCHDSTVHVYWCATCDAFHVGHDVHRPKFMHTQWRERKWRRKRGKGLRRWKLAY